MFQNHTDDVARVRNKLERFRLSNADLSQQLSDTLRRSQRLASSLGFRDIYEAQVAIDTADSDLSYRQCFEELETLRAQVRELTGQQDGALSIAKGLHISDLVPGEIAVDVLPYALRLAYCEVSGLRQCDADELLAEGTIRMYEMTDSGLEILQRNAKLVREWEDIFSFRRKDRKSRVSRLTIGESFRFQRALYRMTLVSWLYGEGSIPESDMLDGYYPYSDKYQDRQTKFLMQYPTDDLFQIDFVSRLILYVAQSVMVKDRGYVSMRDVYDWDGIFLFGGPSNIMKVYRNREVEDNHCREILCYPCDDDGPASGFLTCALKRVFKARRVFDSNFNQRILDHVEGADDLCVQCQSQSDIYRGTLLRNESTWDDLMFTDVFFDWDFLQSSLGLKYPETGLFSNKIQKTPTRRLMEEIFELRQGEYTSWKREDWICMSCWMGLISDTIPMWWAEHRPQQI